MGIRNGDFFKYLKEAICELTKLFEEAKNLNERGLHLQAYRKLEPFGELTGKEDVETVLLMSAITHNLGANKLSRRLVFRAFRLDPAHPRALFYKASEIFNRRGPVPALIFIRRRILRNL